MAIALLLLFFTLTWEKLGVVVSYELNKTYITQVLCENKDRPALQCDGQCILGKKLQEDTSQDPTIPPLTFEEKPVQPLYSTPGKKCCWQPDVLCQPRATDVAILQDREEVAGIFHPPKWTIS